MMYEPMTAPQTQQMMYDILTDDQIQRFEETWELDFSYALQRKARFRVNVFKDKGSVAAALRLIPTKMPTLQELGYSNVLEKLTKLKRGLVLVTGPTGSGKSTTLAAMIHTINTTRSEHIITIEDPVEYLHVHRMSVINQRELGQDTKSFQAALRASLREDPDVILVGEMRDLETMQLAISAAETGHLVFATLHTNSAASTVDRIIDAFPAGQQAQVRLQLANNIQAVICQTLCPRADGPGRVGVQEIMLATPAIRNLVREGKAHQITSTIQTSGGVGMTTLDQALRDAYLARKISYDEAIVRAQNADELKKMISASGGDAGSPGARPPAR
jgi:twitching motility protein PilT